MTSNDPGPDLDLDDQDDERIEDDDDEDEEIDEEEEVDYGRESISDSEYENNYEAAVHVDTSESMSWYVSQ